MLTKEQVLEVENKLLNAIIAGDINTLDYLLHNDLLFITPDGQTITKAMDLASHKAGTMVVEHLIPNIELVNLIDDLAIVTLTLDTKGKMLGQPIQGCFRYIRVWKLFETSLKVIAGSCTQV